MESKTKKKGPEQKPEAGPKSSLDHLEKFESLLAIMHKLRAPGGCPWDQEQTHATLAKYALEESHELADAITLGSDPSIVDELGDVLLQVVFHAEIGKEENRFTIEDVIRAISEKLVRRHPHVFADTKVSGSDEVLKNWDEIKKTEKKHDTTVRLGAPVGQPALMRAHKIGSTTKKEKFDWPNKEGVMEQLRSEMKELEEALHSGNKPHIESEIGDMLFTLSQLSRHLESDAEQILKETNTRFERRYFTMKELCARDVKKWDSLTTNEKEEYWIQAKVALGTPWES